MRLRKASMLHLPLAHSPQVWLRIRSGCRLVIRRGTEFAQAPAAIPAGVLDAALQVECAAKEPEHLEVVTNRRSPSPNWFELEANSNRETLNNFKLKAITTSSTSRNERSSHGQLFKRPKDAAECTQ